jgi:hypothetical protein
MKTFQITSNKPPQTLKLSDFPINQSPTVTDSSSVSCGNKFSAFYVSLLDNSQSKRNGKQIRRSPYDVHKAKQRILGRFSEEVGWVGRVVEVMEVLEGFT